MSIGFKERYTDEFDDRKYLVYADDRLPHTPCDASVVCDRPIQAADTTPRPASGQAGLKHDQGKPRWDLLPIEIIGKIVDVMTFGAKKYDDNNWKNVDNGAERYYAAAMRHLAAWRRGERADAESGLHPLAHALCGIMFAFWLEEHKSDER